MCAQPADIPTSDDEFFRSLVENATDIIVRCDANRNRVYVSPSSFDVLGFHPSEMLGKGAYELVHPNDLMMAREVFGSVGPNCPRASLRFRMRRKDGAYLWIEGRYRYLAADNEFLSVLRDITIQKSIEDKLAETNAKLEAANRALSDLAERDGLTGLANRRRFDTVFAQEFSHACDQGVPLGLVLLDVDYFKLFNDTYGHLAGDDCLRQVAQAIQGVLVRASDYAFRFGGEEFVALLPTTSDSGTLQIAGRMRQAVAELQIPHRGSPFGIVTTSAGAVTLWTSKTAAAQKEFLAAADQALYQAKLSGRNRICDGTRNLLQALHI